MKKNLNNSIKEIVNLFWSNISMSDLLNKERERTYFNLNIEKLLNISNVNYEKQISILKDWLNNLKQLQLNSNKKQFTNDIHKYLNTEINQQLSQSKKIILPVEIDDQTKTTIQNVLKYNYVNENCLRILDELSILFEISIDKFHDDSIFNGFFQNFTNIFKYFSWRLLEYGPKLTQDMINKSIDRFIASIETFKSKIIVLKIEQPNIQYNHFYEFEKYFHLRTNENQL